ncbi:MULTISPECIES: asparagine synthase-related protein [unclassified Novosphingobium]|uniref:asparagine synthase-related protein n=1 Tax=unclassified Novosphingobium TaxID=2644732 RepID=UPI0013570576|nr:MULTISPECIES: asparagine synthase-related protein [unclassified Novosphingobium]
MTAICTLWNRDGADATDMARPFAMASRRYGREPWRSWSGGSVLLGRCLFPLLPEDRLDEPLDNELQRWIVAADVRLTERGDLAAQLGLDPGAMSDGAIVAAALERWGEAAFERIYGVFAVIAWDRQERRLVLARDAMGDRPLYYHAEAGRFAAASMPDILLADPATPRTPDVEQYRQFLRMNSFAPGRSAYTGIDTVRPGHMLVVSGTGQQEIAWWKPDLTPLLLDTQAEYEDTLSRAIESAVGTCLRRASGKVGAHLSAGFDSTAVATTAALALARDGQRITAFVAAPREGPVRTMATRHLADESHVAARTAAMHGNMDLVRVVPGQGPLAGLDRTRALYPSPIINLCNLPWFEEINDIARDHGVSVLLHGLMGNSSISESGIWALRELAQQRRFKLWLRTARGLVRGGWMRWRGVLFNTVEDLLPDRLWRWGMALSGRTIENDRDMSLLTDSAYDEAAQAHCQAAAEAGEPVPDAGPFGRERGISSVECRLISTRTNGAGDQYKAMLAEWGLDLRDPTADRRLFELALRIPVERLVWDGEPRAILRRVLADRAPPEVLDNRQRGYQGADWAQAICQDRQAFIAEMERLELYEPTAAFLDTAKVRRLIADLPEAGSADWDSDEAENSYRLACLLTISAASHMRNIARSNL